MKSVVVKRLIDGTPVWNKDYEAFQKLLGFTTVLHRIAHPWSKKGKVEQRLVKYMRRISYKEGDSQISMSSTSQLWSGAMRRTILQHGLERWFLRKNIISMRF